MVCKKLRSPHGRSLIGAATGSGADGCSARAAGSKRAAHVNSFLIILEQMAGVLQQSTVDSCRIVRAVVKCICLGSVEESLGHGLLLLSHSHQAVDATA